LVTNIGRTRVQGVSFKVKIAVSSRAYKGAATQTLRSIAGSKPAAYLYTHRKLLARSGAVLLATATLVGFVSFRNTPEVSVVTAVPAQTEVIQVAKPEAAVASKPVTEPITDPTISTAPLIGDFGFSLGSPDQSSVMTPSTKAKESLTAPKPEAIPSPVLPAVAETPQPAPEPTAVRKEFVEIAVQLTIDDGRVAGAQIQNRQPGAEAFEATALHIARQRRYPPGTSRMETVVVRVANEFGRKEP
jgi:hypothetical protein